MNYLQHLNKHLFILHFCLVIFPNTGIFDDFMQFSANPICSLNIWGQWNSPMWRHYLSFSCKQEVVLEIFASDFAVLRGQLCFNFSENGWDWR